MEVRPGDAYLNSKFCWLEKCKSPVTYMYIITRRHLVSPHMLGKRHRYLFIYVEHQYTLATLLKTSLFLSFPNMGEERATNHYLLVYMYMYILLTVKSA